MDSEDQCLGHVRFASLTATHSGYSTQVYASSGIYSPRVQTPLDRTAMLAMAALSLFVGVEGRSYEYLVYPPRSGYVGPLV
jgi:hypothetical protein